MAYTQSASLCLYLIERYGKERFLKLYDVPFELIDLERLYGKKGEGLVDEWLGVVTALPIDTAEARAFYAQMKSLRGR